jgi:hypothetical protein
MKLLRANHTTNRRAPPQNWVVVAKPRKYTVAVSIVNSGGLKIATYCEKPIGLLDSGARIRKLR